jgi:hypothetical protein
MHTHQTCHQFVRTCFRCTPEDKWRSLYLRSPHTMRLCDVSDQNQLLSNDHRCSAITVSTN